MNCIDREQAIALYAGGDLPSAEAPELEQHLAGCAACREQLESERRALDWLQQDHPEEIGPAQYASVRARVLETLARERRPVWWGRLSTCGRLPIGLRRLTLGAERWVASLPHNAWWAWGLAGAAAVLVIAMLFPPRVTTPVKLQQPLPSVEPRTAAVRPEVGAGLSLPARALPRGGTRLATLSRGAGRLKPAPPRLPETIESAATDLAAAEAKPSEQFVIKLLTDDPDVVIYWIADSKGE